MDRERQSELKKELIYKQMIKSLARGLLAIKNESKKRHFLLGEILALLIIWFQRHAIKAYILSGNTSQLVSSLFGIALFMALISMIFATIYLFGIPLHAREIEKNLWRIHFVNAADEAPTLIGYSTNEGNITLEFETYGIPVSAWRDKQAELESAIDCNIIKIFEGQSKRRIIIEAKPSKFKLSNSVEWDETIRSNEDFKLAVGRGLTGDIYWDLSVIPHGLIGGSTGSGKTVLLKCLIHQCIMKKAEVIIADFKGGVDFGKHWEPYTKIITDKYDLLEYLHELIHCLDERKQILNDSNCKDIGEYNDKFDKKTSRIILACDEIAEVLDKTGANNEEKKLIAEVENLLSTIARQGRAFGIHLILGTQRPDATILSGQIKNNIDFRICGRADDVLSRIILDNTSASDTIPKESQGRFVTNAGTVLQGYHFKD